MAKNSAFRHIHRVATAISYGSGFAAYSLLS